jgi:lipopolysaccharide/colanic/teichoic acid biosynthesis glycosyltransferase
MDRLSKRTFDLLATGAGALVFAPVLAGIAAAIVLDDGRPVLFRQERIGKQRRPFEIVKFRTMRDGSVTRVGRWLRATGLDETMQFVNVLRGEMSLVGPRPLTAQDIERLGWDDPGYDWRFQAKPGIAGLSQLFAGHSARMSRRLDRIAVARDSLAFDVGIVAAAFAVNLLGKRRFRQLVGREY